MFLYSRLSPAFYPMTVSDKARRPVRVFPANRTNAGSFIRWARRKFGEYYGEPFHFSTEILRLIISSASRIIIRIFRLSLCCRGLAKNVRVLNQPKPNLRASSAVPFHIRSKVAPKAATPLHDGMRPKNVPSSSLSYSACAKAFSR